MPRLGQHFLCDPNIVRKIVENSSLKPNDTVLEIGPGKGILTRALAGKAGHVISIELDRELFLALKSRSQQLSNVTFILGDALTYPLETIPFPFRIVANLPYYISTPLIFRLLEFRNRITDMVLMVQKEVAERIVAIAGGKPYSPLSIAVQYYTDPRLLFSVSRRCFKPAPRVDSAVVHLKIRATPPVDVKDHAFFFKVVKGGFAHRRKVLKNSLKDSGFSKEVLDRASFLSGLNFNRRAETFSIQEFAQLSDILFEVSG